MKPALILAAICLTPVTVSFAQRYNISAAAPPLAAQTTQVAGYEYSPVPPPPTANPVGHSFRRSTRSTAQAAPAVPCDGAACDSIGEDYFAEQTPFTGDSTLAGCGDGGCNGSYFTLFLGSSDMDDQTSTGVARNLEIDFNQGYAVGGAIGRRITRNTRLELEYAFRSQTPQDVTFNGVAQSIISGEQNSHAGMLNVAYDLLLGNSRLVPYLGAGIGVASVDSRVAYGPGVASLNGDDSAVAYQWMAGLSYRARPNMEWFAEYRFFEIDDPKINRFGGPAIGTSPNPNVLLDSEYISQDIIAGLRFNF